MILLEWFYLDPDVQNKHGSGFESKILDQDPAGYIYPHSQHWLRTKRLKSEVEIDQIRIVAIDLSRILVKKKFLINWYRAQ